jgi:hypothetical protein
VSLVGPAHFLIAPRETLREAAQELLGDAAEMFDEPAIWRHPTWCDQRSTDELKVTFLQYFEHEWIEGSDGLDRLVRHVLQAGMSADTFDRWWSITQVDEVHDLDGARATMAARAVAREQQRTRGGELRQLFAARCTVRTLLEQASDLGSRRADSEHVIELFMYVFDLSRDELVAIFDDWAGFGGRNPGLKAEQIEERHGEHLRARLRTDSPGQTSPSRARLPPWS